MIFCLYAFFIFVLFVATDRRGELCPIGAGGRFPHPVWGASGGADRGAEAERQRYPPGTNLFFFSRKEKFNENNVNIFFSRKKIYL